MQMDRTFPHSYEVEEWPELLGTGKFNVPVRYFPRPTKTRPEHESVVSTPDLDRACVISRGTAYVVKAGEPDIWEEIPVMLVLDVRPIPELQPLLFADFTRLAAYGSNGLVWRSPQVCWVELKLLNLTATTSKV